MGLGNPLQKCKYAVAIAPGAIKDNASFTATEIDTLGYDYCTIVVQLGATDIAMAALKVRETDTSGSGQTDIAAATIANAACLDIAGSATVLPSATDDNKVIVFNLDMRKYGRYLDVVATAGDGTNGTYLSATAILSRAEVGPITSANAGADTVVVC